MTNSIKQTPSSTKNEKTKLFSDDPQWIFKNIPYEHPEEKKELNDNVNLNGSVNDTYGLRIDAQLIQGKQRVIAELKTCTYRTSPKKIASLLEKLFNSSETKPGWWLYVAQHWPPRPINRVIAQMIKQHQLGQVTIKNPAALFTYLIQKREKRKRFIGINDTHKQREV